MPPGSNNPVIPAADFSGSWYRLGAATPATDYAYGYSGSVRDTGTSSVRGDADSGTHAFSSSAGSFTVAPDCDVNNDGCIGVLDAILVGQQRGEAGTPHWLREDVDRDEEINVSDLIVVGQHWRTEEDRVS